MPLGKIRHDGVDLIANLLGRNIAILLHVEPNNDLRNTFCGGGRQIVDAANGIDCTLDLVGDIRFHLFRAAPARCVVTITNVGKVRIGKFI